MPKKLQISRGQRMKKKKPYEMTKKEFLKNYPLTTERKYTGKIEDFYELKTVFVPTDEDVIYDSVIGEYETDYRGYWKITQSSFREIADALDKIGYKVSKISIGSRLVGEVFPTTEYTYKTTTNAPQEIVDVLLAWQEVHQFDCCHRTGNFDFFDAVERHISELRHYAHIQKALHESKNVPKRVLKEYK